MTIFPALLAGLAAGLGVALPLGAVGILIIQQGISAGFRSGSAAAAGVALVDLAYCAAALAFGAAVAPLVASAGRWPAAVAGLVLMDLGANGLRKVHTTAGPPLPAVSGGPGKVLAAFTWLTALNPATVLYFLALATALGRGGWPWETAAAFTAGVGVASLGWQLVLAAIGSVAGRRITPRGRRLLSAGGHSVVMVLGVVALGAALLS
ncbi:LysE family transporter [Pseudarthrobacter sp. P1]|uniref:LysE family transporter n=1 Tax=Pseudarthrobacter sp. P1 TaxID=3418418 RepID=UPI003CF8E0A5